MHLRENSVYDPWTGSERLIRTMCESIRLILFRPLLRLLDDYGVTPNMVTYASAVVGVSSAVVIAFNLKLSAALLATSFILDGIDGSLARYARKSSNAGSITDGFCDQIVITATAMGFVGAGLLNPLLAMAYVAMYPVVVLFTIIQKRMYIETTYTLRPRFLVYTAFFIFIFSGKNLLNPLVIGASLLLARYMIVDFIKIRRRLKYG